MSDSQIQEISVGERLAGKWQIPVFIIATGVLTAVALNIQSPDRKVGVETHLEHIAAYNEAGMYVAADKLAERILSWEDLPKATRGELHKHKAWAAFGAAERIADESDEVFGKVVKEYLVSIDLGAVLSADDYRRLAKCYEGLKQFELACKSYGMAAEIAPPPALADRRRVIELSEYPLRVSATEIDKLLEEFIADAQDSLDDLIWALSRRVDSLSKSKGWEDARRLLDTYKGKFAETDLEPEYSFLISLTLWGGGQYDEAERQLRDLLNRTTVSDSVFPKAGWLLGKVVMSDGQAQRPEEAVALFRDVISSRANPSYVTASRVSLAEALAELQRYEDSLKSYEDAIEDLDRISGDHLVNPEVVRTSLAVVSETCRRSGKLRFALEFMKLAVSLIEAKDLETYTKFIIRQSDLQAMVAREIVETAKTESVGELTQIPTEARVLFDQAGENYVKAAWMNTLNERRSADAMWSAAGLFDEGGNHERAIDVLKAFVRDRSDAEIIPRVLLRLGRSLQAEGRYGEAIEAFQQNISSFPRSPHASASLIPLAECFMAIGEEGEKEAEAALTSITKDSEIFTPEAPEYRDAMFLLGDLYTRQGEYEKAIPVLDEVLQKYVTDPRYPKAKFLLAGAYMKSAKAIKEEMLQPEYVGESKRLEAEFKSRLVTAISIFGELTKYLEQQDELTLGKLDRLYLQDSRLYEGACLFELGRYEDALVLYERAAWIYKDSPVALGAYVQVINCYIFLGREEEAEAALRRAQYLVETIAEDKFQGEGRLESREGWRSYFDWVAEILVSGEPRRIDTGLNQ